jgi:DNA processing protein
MVDAGGVGVAVLGCGLDVAYPREHRDLAEALVSLGGAIVTEYPPGTPPEAWRFPPRNRIISGLSAAVVVVEANERGGALITAACALEQGVPVFAVPGDVDRAASRGCNLLIRDGAHPVLDPADLVAELELVLGPAARPEVEAPPPVDVVPPEGIDLDSLASELDLTPAEALATTSRWEAQGRATREGERIYPVRVDR